MKIALPKTNRSGMATIIVLAILAIMLVYITANVRAISALHQELKLVEQRQMHRLAVQNGKILSNTNSLPAEPQAAHP